MTSSQSKIYLDDVVYNGSKAQYAFHVEGDVESVIKPNSTFEIDFYEDIERVPLSILVIPFVTNVLPAVWLYDAALVLPSIDSDFYGHIEKIRNGYVSMYPGLSFSGHIEAGEVVDNPTMITNESEPMLLFSGGVDATSSLITLLKRGNKPRLLTLWGADVSLYDMEGWGEKSSHTKFVASRFGLDVSLARTGFRGFLDESVLNKKVAVGTDDQWWHGFQHGIGIIGHAAPLAYLHGSSSVYIAASFTRGEDITCASDPTIDEHVYVAGCNTVHDGYDYSRQDKIANIHNFVVESGIKELPIKVCWISVGAKNCGKCEKCMRSAIGFLAEGADLSVYDLAEFNFEYAKRYITKVHYFRHTLQWEKIQSRLRANLRNLDENMVRDLGWVLDIDFTTINRSVSKKLRHNAKKLKGAIAGRIPAGIRFRIKKLLA